MEDKCEKIHELELAVVRLEEMHKSDSKALGVAETLLKEWKLSSNEWRDENRDQRALYPTIDAVNGLILKTEGLITTEAVERKNLEKRIDALEKAQIGVAAGISAISTMWAKIVASVTIFLTVLGLYLKYAK